MAEVLGIAASGAGLLSLSLQLIDGAQKLRQRYESTEKLPESIKNLTEDLETMAWQLRIVETDADDILEQQRGPIMLARCRGRLESVTKQLTSLTAVVPVALSKRSRLKAALQSKKWKSELEELQSQSTSLENHIAQLLVIQSAIATKKLQRCLIRDTNNDASLSQDENSSKVPETPGLDVSRSTFCTALQCRCSCHATHLMSGRWWRLQYSPLAEILKSCNDPACTSRRHRLNIRVALSRLGVPWTVAFGLDLNTEPGRYWLQPALQIERVVKHTTPGFVILYKLSKKRLDWEDAQTQFRDFYKSDPGFVHQGLMFYGAWGVFGSNFEDQKRLLEFFITDLHMTEGFNNINLLYLCASFNQEDRHLDMISSLISLGCDFSDAASPTFESWPEPCIEGMEVTAYRRVITEDPFFVDFLGTILKVNPDFGDSPLLHSVILHGSQCDFDDHVRRACQPLETNTNFLGQSPLHMAVRRPSRLTALLAAGHDVDTRDKYGATALMYAAAMGLPEAMSILIEHSANLFIRDSLDDRGYNFVTYAAIRNHWPLLWQAIDLITIKDSSLVPRILPGIFIAKDFECYLPYGPNDVKEGYFKFWFKVISKLGNPNVHFDDGRTLMHVVDHSELARLIIMLGFTEFNQRNASGEHSLFAVARFLDPSLFRLFIDKGADINMQNNKGRSVLHELTDILHGTMPRRSKEPLDILYSSMTRQYKGLLETLDLLLDSGASVAATDHCSSHCSLGGCMPGSNTTLEVEAFLGIMLSNPFWIFEWLMMLEERELFVEAKDCALSIFRRTYFKEAGLQYRCCQSMEFEEERFWDIREKIKVDELNTQMLEWGAKEYEEVKLGLMVHLERRETEKVKIARLTKGGSNEERLKGFQASLVCCMESNDLDDEDDELGELFIAVDNMDLPGFCLPENETKTAFDEFVNGLREARGDKFSSRLPLLSQLADVFSISIQ
ncbi:hypothetical protein NM208_g14693 [Fusarium decemcellulare]|uniref:Uncharacterized protein n=1 Tax=Fusarium decemcellulare TaxID=57161 RepID=A0ACC1RF80_9HYPO|nr:hypothetical protein NM208_g14693 [Fusarium decemcellulare]